MKYTHYLLLTCGILLGLSSCEKDDPEVNNDEELITTVIYTLTSTVDGSEVMVSFRDLDGDGGDDPIMTGGTLQANTVYNGSLTLSNESEDPTEDITEEIEEEDDEHQLFYQLSDDNIMVAYDDADEEGNPIGLRTILTTGEAGDNTITITLRHELDKSAAGVAQGEIDNAGGSTDVEVTLSLDVE